MQSGSTYAKYWAFKEYKKKSKKWPCSQGVFSLTGEKNKEAVLTKWLQWQKYTCRKGVSSEVTYSRTPQNGLYFENSVGIN